MPMRRAKSTNLGPRRLWTFRAMSRRSLCRSHASSASFVALLITCWSARASRIICPKVGTVESFHGFQNHCFPRYRCAVHSASCPSLGFQSGSIGSYSSASVIGYKSGAPADDIDQFTLVDRSRPFTAVNVALSKVAPVTFAPVKSALVRSAPSNSTLLKSAPLKCAPASLA